MPATPTVSFLNESTASWPVGKVPIETLLRAKHGASKRKGGLNAPCLRKLLTAVGKLQPGSKPSARVVRDTFVQHFDVCRAAFAIPIWSESELQRFGVTAPALMSRQLFRAYCGRTIGPRDWLRSKVNPATGKLLSVESHPATGTRPLTRQRLRVTPDSNPFRTRNWYQPHPLDLIPEMQSFWYTLCCDNPATDAIPAAFAEWWNAPDEPL